MSKSSSKPVPRSQARRRFTLSDRQILLVVLGINLLVSLAVFDPKLAPAGDNAQYIILAKSILGGRYADLHAPGTPPHSQFPPVLPLLMAPLIAVFGLNFVALKFLILACSLGGIATFYLLLKRLFSGRDWIFPLLLLAFSPLYLEYSHDTFSEVPFILLSLLGLYFLFRSEANHGTWNVERRTSNDVRRTIYVGAAGLFASAAFLTRTQGLTLPLAIALYLLIRRRWADLGVFALVFVAVWLPWLIRDLHVPHTGGYREQLFLKDEYNLGAGYVSFGDIVRRVFENIGIYLFRVLPVIFVPVLEHAGSFLLGVLGVALAGVGVTGMVTRIRQRGLGPLELYLVFTLGLLTLWPAVWSGDRFLLPVLPIIVLYIVWGMPSLARRFKIKYLPAIVTALLLLSFGVVNAGRAQSAMSSLSGYLKGDHLAGYDDYWRTYFDACAWLRDHTDSDAVVVSRKPQFTYLFSGRQSYTYPFVADENRVLASIDSLGATHAFLETFFSSSVNYLYPVIRDHPDRFEEIGSVGTGDTRVIVFRVKR